MAKRYRRWQRISEEVTEILGGEKPGAEADNARNAPNSTAQTH